MHKYEAGVIRYMYLYREVSHVPWICTNMYSLCCHDYLEFLLSQNESTFRTGFVGLQKFGWGIRWIRSFLKRDLKIGNVLKLQNLNVFISFEIRFK